MDKMKHNKIYLLLIMVMLLIIGNILVFQETNIAQAYNTTDLPLSIKYGEYANNISPFGISFYDYLNDYAEIKVDHKYTLLGVNIESKHYKGALFSNNVQYATQNSVVYGYVDGDDNIVKLIPRELFTYENKTLYIGKKYGFLIVTEPYGSVLQSNVIFIEVVGDVNDYLADIKLCVRESLTFVYITQNQSMILPSVPTMDNSGMLANYVLQNGISSAVVPLAGIQVVTNATTEKD